MIRCFLTLYLLLLLSRPTLSAGLRIELSRRLKEWRATVDNRFYWNILSNAEVSDIADRCLLTYEERSEEHTSELQTLIRISIAVFSLTKKTNTNSTALND